jgi:hypothetical protein
MVARAIGHGHGGGRYVLRRLIVIGGSLLLAGCFDFESLRRRPDAQVDMAPSAQDMAVPSDQAPEPPDLTPGPPDLTPDLPDMTSEPPDLTFEPPDLTTQDL